MKIRNGFVSNSSSSSFLIISKKDELSSEKLLEIFDVKDTSPIYSVIETLSKDIIDCTEKMTTEEYLDNYAYGDTLEEKEKELEEDYPEYFEYYKLAKENDWKIYYGSADTDEDATVSNLILNHEDDDIIINMSGDC